MSDTSDKMPPAAVEVEASVLGAVLCDNRCIGDVMAVLGGDGGMFYDARHGRIYDAAIVVYSTLAPVDQITVGAELTKRSELELVGGVAYLSELASGVAGGSHAGHHAKLIADAALARGLIEAYSTGATQALMPGADPVKISQAVDHAIYSLGTTDRRNAIATMEETMEGTLALIEKAQTTSGLSGVHTGLHDLDNITSGWQNSDLIVLAARPKQGKTSLAMLHALTAARSGVAVMFFSMEMSKEQLGARMIAMTAGVDLHKMRKGVLAPDEYKTVMQVAAEIAALPIHIDDNSATTVLEMRAKLRRRRVGLVIADYLQLMGSTDKNAKSREQEVSGFSRGLKGLAKEFNVPVIALSQLSRAPEQRNDKRPVLSDLRDSGAIEQDADLVTFIYRAESYGIKVDSDGNSTEGVADIIVGAHRNGPPGTIRAQFDTATVNFRDLAPQYLR